MMCPSDVDPGDEVARGEALGPVVGGLAMQNFKIGGAWDWQRVGPDRVFMGVFTDFANASIGLYAAGAGLPESVVLEVANEYAARNSRFSASAQMDITYTNLRVQNVSDIRLG